MFGNEIKYKSARNLVFVFLFQIWNKQNNSQSRDVVGDVTGRLNFIFY